MRYSAAWATEFRRPTLSASTAPRAISCLVAEVT